MGPLVKEAHHCDAEKDLAHQGQIVAGPGGTGQHGGQKEQQGQQGAAQGRAQHRSHRPGRQQADPAQHQSGDAQDQQPVPGKGQGHEPGQQKQQLYHRRDPEPVPAPLDPKSGQHGPQAPQSPQRKGAAIPGRRVLLGLVHPGGDQACFLRPFMGMEISLKMMISRATPMTAERT